MKASQLCKGKRAIHRVRLPLLNFRCEILADLPELDEARRQNQQTDEDVEVGIRVLTALELADALTTARKFAKARGVEDPKDNDPIYDLGKAAAILALACVDPETPADREPEPFFESVDEILASPHIGRDGLAFLHEHWETWQDLCAPQAGKLDAMGLAAATEALAGENGFGFFLLLRPSLRWSCTHFLACQQSTAPKLKSGSSSNSDSTSTSRSSGPSPDQETNPPPDVSGSSTSRPSRPRRRERGRAS